MWPDRSPTAQARVSVQQQQQQQQQQQKNRMTFSSRIVSAADGSELWHLSRPATMVGELRPNTTSTYSRHGVADSGQKPSLAMGLGRKVSDNHMHLGHMKVVGYAAGFHGGGGGDSRDKVSAVIAEDEEMFEEEPSASFTVTGKSGIFRECSSHVSILVRILEVN